LEVRALSSAMKIQAFPSGPFETNAYIIACEETNQAVIVDPAPDSAAIIKTYLSKNQFTPQKILLTHSHWDHIADVATLKDYYKIPVFVHPLDTPNLESPGADSLPCWITIEGVKPDGFLNENDVIAIGNNSFSVLHTPGHSPGSLCLYCKKANILISGDTLFRGSMGNISFPTSQPDLMWISLDKLAKLPPNTIVYPGHGPSTTIGKETWLSRQKNYSAKQRRM
jgi:hydroxyacylglutathione hydrolase